MSQIVDTEKISQIANIDKLRKIRDNLFTAFFPSLFIILVFLLSFKDIFRLLKSTKKGIKKIYTILIIFGIFFIAIGVITAYFVINNKITLEEIYKTISSKCYNEKMEKAKKEIIEECNKSDNS